MGQQLHIRYKRQRRNKWIQRKKMADRAKAEKVKSKPAIVKTPPATLARSDGGLGEVPAKPVEPKAVN